MSGTKRSAKGRGSHVHLIHREAVPLPLKGKDNAPLPWARLRMSGGRGCRGPHQFSDNRSVQSSRCWAGSPHPPQAVPIPRKDRVESEEWRVELSTGFGSVDCNVGRSCYPDLIHREAVPLPLIGEGLSAAKSGRGCECRARCPLSTVHS